MCDRGTSIVARARALKTLDLSVPLFLLFLDNHHQHKQLTAKDQHRLCPCCGKEAVKGCAHKRCAKHPRGQTCRLHTPNKCPCGKRMVGY